MATAPDTAANQNVTVDLQVLSGVASVPRDQDIQACVEAAIRRVHPGEVRGLELAVRIVDEEEGRALNLKFRRQDNATNVLSFPADADVLPDEVPRQLGDIVICGPVVEREAAQQGKTASAHYSHMLVHGALHLLGFEHESAEDAAAMESLETEILAERGVADPYGCP